MICTGAESNDRCLHAGHAEKSHGNVPAEAGGMRPPVQDAHGHREPEEAGDTRCGPPTPGFGTSGPKNCDICYSSHRNLEYKKKSKEGPEEAG